MASMEEELSLHYSLTQTGDSQKIENESNENSNQSNSSLDSNDDNKSNQEPEQSGDNYFDPFAVEDNHKKFGEITLEQKLPETQEIDDDDDDIDIPSKSNQKDETDADNNNNKLDADQMEADTVQHNDDIYCDDDDLEDDDDEQLRQEMEAQFKKVSKEKNQNMTSLLQMIRSKHKNPPKKQNNPKPNRKKINNNIPSIKPFANNGEIKIVFDVKLPQKQKKDKEREAQKQHFHPVNGSKLRKNIKQNLKKQISKKRKKDIRKYRKEFGKEEDSYNEEKPRHNLIDNEPEIAVTKSVTPALTESDMDETMEDQANSNGYKADVEAKEDSDIEEMNASEYIENIVERGDELDEEDLARAALMRQPEKISKEVAAYMDIAAEEENENGEIVTKFEDEYEEKHGIAKNLLADKADIKFIKKNEEIYNAKRNEMHQMLLNKEDDKELELMKKAFVDGDYRALQNKAKHKYAQLLDECTNDGENALKFKSRHAESNLLRNDPNYYLSDDEDKNEFCCYDKNGIFLPVDSIRMKIMEWNRNKNKENMLVDEDEEDTEAVKVRQERVRKREMLRAHSLDNVQNKNKISSEDQSAIKILQKLRNKKKKKKPGLAKANSLSTNFGAFYLEKGLKIPSLNRTSTHSGSFLKHREKCIERVLAESKSKTNSSSSSLGGRKHVVFKKQSNSKKRKRDDNYMNYNSGLSKKRRIN